MPADRSPLRVLVYLWYPEWKGAPSHQPPAVELVQEADARLLRLALNLPLSDGLLSVIL